MAVRSIFHDALKPNVGTVPVMVPVMYGRLPRRKGVVVTLFGYTN